ncbi:Transcriptional coactivator p15 (PC4) [Rhabdaerophilaceae bacterium]
MTSFAKRFEPVIVAEFQRNARERVRIVLDCFQGNAVVSIRVWYALPNGSFRPGRDGITLSVKHLASLADGYCEAYRLACEHGLIDPDQDNAAS